MRNHYIKSFVLALLSALALSACGGGGGDGDGGSPAAVNTAPADPDAYSLIHLKSLSPSTMSFDMTGTDGTNDYTAHLTIINDSKDYLVNGQKLTRVISKVTLTNVTTGADPAFTNGSSYYTSDYTLIFVVDEDKNITCTPKPGTYKAPPDSAKINDFGTIVSLTCADKGKNPTNKTINIIWRLDVGATADEAKFVVTQSSVVNDVADSTEVDNYIIDHAGYVSGIEVSVTTAAGVRTLSGNRS